MNYSLPSRPHFNLVTSLKTQSPNTGMRSWRLRLQHMNLGGHNLSHYRTFLDIVWMAIWSDYMKVRVSARILKSRLCRTGKLHSLKNTALLGLLLPSPKSMKLNRKAQISHGLVMVLSLWWNHTTVFLTVPIIQSLSEEMRGLKPIVWPQIHTLSIYIYIYLLDLSMKFPAQRLSFLCLRLTLWMNWHWQ